VLGPDRGGRGGQLGGALSVPEEGQLPEAFEGNLSAKRSRAGRSMTTVPSSGSPACAGGCCQPLGCTGEKMKERRKEEGQEGDIISERGGRRNDTNFLRKKKSCSRGKGVSAGPEGCVWRERKPQPRQKTQTQRKTHSENFPYPIKPTDISKEELAGRLKTAREPCPQNSTSGKMNHATASKTRKLQKSRKKPEQRKSDFGK